MCVCVCVCRYGVMVLIANSSDIFQKCLQERGFSCQKERFTQPLDVAFWSHRLEKVSLLLCAGIESVEALVLIS